MKPSSPPVAPAPPAITALQDCPWLRLLATLLVVWIAGGAACARQQRVPAFAPPPVVFESVPSLERLAEVVNRTDAIQKLQSNSATVAAPEMASTELSAMLVLERDKRFRMKAKISPLPTTIVDLGSNEEVFWLQMNEGIRRTLYFARHDEYAQQSQRMILPVDPTWLISALGLVHLDPTEVTEGPTRRPDGQLEVRSQVAMPDGDYRRVYVIHEQTGVVTEQYLYGPSNQLVARSVASQHRYYEAQQCSLPHQVRIHLQPAMGPPMALEMEIGEYTINQILSGDPQLFEMPQNASQQVNLATIAGPLAGLPGGAVPVDPPPLSGAPPLLPGASTPLELPPGAAPGDGDAAPRTAHAAGYAPAQNYQPTLRGTVRR